MKRATDLAIQWVGAMGALSLVLSLAALLVNAMTVKDPDVAKGAQAIAQGCAVAAVSGLVGYIGGYHSAVATHKPNKPEIET